MKILCSICARGGSKGVKNKNTRLLLDKPLIAHTIAQAKKIKAFDFIVVSSDSDEILEVSKKFGADILIKRPDELASDSAGKVPAIRHCASEVEKQKNIKFDYFFDLDCTSPLRLLEDIQSCITLLTESKADNVITAMPSRRSPYFNMIETDEKNRAFLSKKLAQNVLRRQDSPKVYDMNGSIYGWTRKNLLESKNDSVFFENTQLFVMPEERSIDIDQEIDFEFVEFLAKKRGSIS